MRPEEVRRIKKAVAKAERGAHDPEHLSPRSNAASQTPNANRCGAPRLAFETWDLPNDPALPQSAAGSAVKCFSINPPA